MLALLEAFAQSIPCFKTCLSWLEKTQPVISDKSFFIFEQEAELQESFLSLYG
jgi:hypothetical protein